MRSTIERSFRQRVLLAIFTNGTYMGSMMKERALWCLSSRMWCFPELGTRVGLATYPRECGGLSLRCAMLRIVFTTSLPMQLVVFLFFRGA